MIISRTTKGLLAGLAAGALALGLLFGSTAPSAVAAKGTIKVENMVDDPTAACIVGIDQASIDVVLSQFPADMSVSLDFQPNNPGDDFTVTGQPTTVTIIGDGAKNETTVTVQLTFTPGATYDANKKGYHVKVTATGTNQSGGSKVFWLVADACTTPTQTGTATQTATETATQTTTATTATTGATNQGTSSATGDESGLVPIALIGLVGTAGAATLLRMGRRQR